MGNGGLAGEKAVALKRVGCRLIVPHRTSKPIAGFGLLLRTCHVLHEYRPAVLTVAHAIVVRDTRQK